MATGLSEVVLAFYKTRMLFMGIIGVILIEDRSIYIFPEIKGKAGKFCGSHGQVLLATSILFVPT